VTPSKKSKEPRSCVGLRKANQRAGPRIERAVTRAQELGESHGRHHHPRTNDLAEEGDGQHLLQAIADALDVSAYDSIDFSFSATSDHADGITIDILTSMQNKMDDIAAGVSSPSWYSIGSEAVASANAGVPAYKFQSVPISSTAAPMLCYVRYLITLGANTTNTSFSIEGLARRGLRVG